MLLGSLAELLDEFREFFSFAEAHFEEANIDGTFIAHVLGNASQKEGQAAHLKIHFHANMNSRDKRRRGLEAAALQVQTNNDTIMARTILEESKDGGPCIALLLLLSALAFAG